MIDNWLEREVRGLFVNLFGGTDEIYGKPQPELSKYVKKTFISIITITMKSKAKHSVSNIQQFKHQLLY